MVDYHAFEPSKSPISGDTHNFYGWTHKEQNSRIDTFERNIRIKKIVVVFLMFVIHMSHIRTVMKYFLRIFTYSLIYSG